jgi:hypothetical protein
VVPGLLGLNESCHLVFVNDGAAILIPRECYEGGEVNEGGRGRARPSVRILREWCRNEGCKKFECIPRSTAASANRARDWSLPESSAARASKRAAAYATWIDTGNRESAFWRWASFGARSAIRMACKIAANEGRARIGPGLPGGVNRLTGI